MKILLIAALTVLCIAAFILLILHIKTRKPFRSLILHSALGLAFLAAVDLLSFFTGIAIPINAYSLTSSAVFGMPAVCGFLILNLIL